jgi:ketosteroid isomerase-like protein
LPAEKPFSGVLSFAKELFVRYDSARMYSGSSEHFGTFLVQPEKPVSLWDPVQFDTKRVDSRGGEPMRRVFLGLFLIFASITVDAQPASANLTDQKAIEAAIAAQADAWNRADIPTFMQSYENSPETTFIGAKLRKGYGPILERYKQSYTTAEQMGKLTFADLDIRLLPSSSGAVEYAVVTGSFHLERAAHGEAKKDDGIFSLVWRKGPQGWKIILDHTS